LDFRFRRKPAPLTQSIPDHAGQTFGFCPALFSARGPRVSWILEAIAEKLGRG
jgi:hypothetical protein